MTVSGRINVKDFYLALLDAKSDDSMVQGNGQETKALLQGSGSPL
jgi:hypothetical protein